MPNYDDAIKAFKFMKQDREEWLENRGRVSLVQIVQTETYVKHCEWAIEQLEILKGDLDEK